jgi:hypothetical protein
MTTQHYILRTSNPEEARVATREELSELFATLIPDDVLEVLAEHGQADDMAVLAETASYEDHIFQAFDASTVSTPSGKSHHNVQHLARRLGWV